MAIKNEISDEQSFSHRTLQYGRGMITLGVLVIVFYWVPLIDIGKSKPLNLAFKEGSEVWIWIILLVLMAYYALRYYALAIPDYFAWKRLHGHSKEKLRESFRSGIANYESAISRLSVAKKQTDGLSQDDPEYAHFLQVIENKQNNVDNFQDALKRDRSAYRDYLLRRFYFWASDVILPNFVFVFAAGSALHRINELSPLCDVVT